MNVIPKEIAPDFENIIEFHESTGAKVSVLSECVAPIHDVTGEDYSAVTNMAIVISGTTAQCMAVEAIVVSVLL